MSESDELVFEDSPWLLESDELGPELELEELGPELELDELGPELSPELELEEPKENRLEKLIPELEESDSNVSSLPGVGTVICLKTGVPETSA